MSENTAKSLPLLAQTMRERGLAVVSCSTNDQEFVKGRAVAARWLRVNWRNRPELSEIELADYLAQTTHRNDHRT